MLERKFSSLQEVSVLKFGVMFDRNGGRVRLGVGKFWIGRNYRYFQGYQVAGLSLITL